jgi:hypothetical protein
MIFLVGREDSNLRHLGPETEGQSAEFSLKSAEGKPLLWVHDAVAAISCRAKLPHTAEFGWSVSECRR